MLFVRHTYLILSFSRCRDPTEEQTAEADLGAMILALDVKISMSDEEHQFESKADAGASKTYPQQAGTIRKGGHIVIKNRACKVC
ncbi:putative ribosomal protein L2, domain 2 [Helianthus anomalus]